MIEGGSGLFAYTNQTFTIVSLSLNSVSCKILEECLKNTASVFLWSEFLSTYTEVRVRFPELSDFLRSIRSGTRSTQRLGYN
jgi:hypothetical protein